MRLPDPSAVGLSMTDRAAVLGELLTDPMRAKLVPRGEAIELLLDLARVQRALELLAVNGAPLADAAQDPDQPLSVDQVMRLTGLSRRGVYLRAHPRNGLAEWRPYIVREGRKTLHFRPAFRQLLAKRNSR